MLVTLKGGYILLRDILPLFRNTLSPFVYLVGKHFLPQGPAFERFIIDVNCSKCCKLDVPKLKS